MNYQESLKFLYGLVNRGIKLGLENTARLLDHFGNPQLKAFTVHIAGTNGKGSTAAFTESILRASGYRVGLYTSPHLLDFRERIQINRQFISEEATAHWISEIKSAAGKLHLQPTFFEVGTVMAFLYFADQKTGWNVIEVGMGGRLDSTNLCRGDVCILTPISVDHESSLGRRPGEIAREKAAIIKSSCPVISGPQDPEALQVIREKTQQHKARLLEFGKDFRTTTQSHSIKRQVFDFNGPEIWYKGLEISLAGRHQAVNAGMAVAGCSSLSEPSITEQAIRTGLKSAAWPGRLEMAAERPTVLLDGAHNPAGLEQLTATLSELYPHQRKIWVLGIMQDKPLAEITRRISNYADYIILTRPQNERSAAPERVREFLVDFPEPVDLTRDIPSALARAQEVARPDDLILITGSLFTVAEAKKVFENQNSKY